MDHPFSEQDFRLLHALQIAPRISWAAAARVLGGTPETLAERWHRLRGEGLAWVTVHPEGLAPMVTAMVEVDCEPGRRGNAARILCADSRVVTVEEVARGCDLLLTVMVADFGALTTFLLEDLGRVEGVTRHRSHLATVVRRHGANWRIRALERNEQAALDEATHRDHVPSSQRNPKPLPAQHWPLVELLTMDGRASAADLARATGRKPATVRRQVCALAASSQVAFRCEIAQEQSHWPIVCNWRARVPTAEHEMTTQALGTLPELRLCLSTTGETNLFFTVWARSLPDLLRIEHLLGEHLPRLELWDSSITLRVLKRMGWLLLPDGRCTGEVVVPDALRP